MRTIELTSWLDDPVPGRFPYDAVVEEFHRVGKHFVPEAVTGALDRVRSALGSVRDDDGSALLRRFLDTALDKWDGRYDYPTYTALSVLPLPSVDDPPAPAEELLRARDRLVTQLVADALRFELAVADGATDLLPEMRPDQRTVAKRYRLGVRVLTNPLRRLGLVGSVTSGDPEGAARQVVAAVMADATPADRRILQLSMLPVYVVHDEYLFIRVLQVFETTFALVAVQLRETVRALTAGDADRAVAALRLAGSMLTETGPAFSLLATMQVEAFRVFRQFTEGASAIQSRNYKTVEALCRRPDPERLASVAYVSVPEVRDRVLQGEATLDEVFGVACSSGVLGGTARDEVAGAMREFSATLLKWRRSHYGIAVRMLGERTGTGYTEGTPYLKAVQKVAVFKSIEHSKEDDVVAPV